MAEEGREKERNLRKDEAGDGDGRDGHGEKEDQEMEAPAKQDKSM